MKPAPAGSPCPALVCSIPKGPAPWEEALTVLRLSTGPLALLQKLGNFVDLGLFFSRIYAKILSL